MWVFGGIITLSKFLREHCRREERNRSQCFLADIDEIVFHWRWNSKNAGGSDPVSGTVFHV